MFRRMDPSARCRQCAGCLSPNCGLCEACLDKPKFGGPNTKRKACVNRDCLVQIMADVSKVTAINDNSLGDINSSSVKSSSENNNVNERFRRLTKSPARFRDFDASGKPSGQKRKLELSPDNESRSSVESKDASKGVKHQPSLKKETSDNQTSAKKAKTSHSKAPQAPAFPHVAVSKYTTPLEFLEQSVMPFLWKHGCAWPFHKPVTAQFDLPDYKDIIKHPMDFGTIKYRMENEYYKSLEHCLKDFELVFSNCYMYNKPDSDVWKMCKQLEKCYMSKIAAIPQELKCRPELKVGQKMECEDRANDLVCVATVAEIRSDKVRVHFDGWEENYDVWLHPWDTQLHPVGWCQENEIALSPPRTCKKVSQFTWEDYLSRKKAVPAPEAALKSNIIPYGFAVGWKLEADDVQNKNVCCATVAKIQGGELLIHYDGWERQYDFWCHPFSKWIHPVGYYKEKNIPLSVPKGWYDIDGFSWETYMKKTDSLPVPRAAFETKKALAPIESRMPPKPQSDIERTPTPEVPKKITNTKESKIKQLAETANKPKNTVPVKSNSNNHRKPARALFTKRRHIKKKTISQTIFRGSKDGSLPALTGLSKHHPGYKLSSKYRPKYKSAQRLSQIKALKLEKSALYQPDIEETSEDEADKSSGSSVSGGTKRKTNNSVSALFTDETLKEVRQASLLLPAVLGKSAPTIKKVTKPIKKAVKSMPKPTSLVENKCVQNKKDIRKAASMVNKPYVSTQISAQPCEDIIEDDSSIPQPVFPPDIVYDRDYKPLGYMTNSPPKPIASATKTVPSILGHPSKKAFEASLTTLSELNSPKTSTSSTSLNQLSNIYQPPKQSTIPNQITNPVQAKPQVIPVSLLRKELQVRPPNSSKLLGVLKSNILKANGQVELQQIQAASRPQTSVVKIQQPNTSTAVPAILKFQPSKIAPLSSTSGPSTVLQFEPLTSSQPTMLTFQATKDHQAALIQIQPNIQPVVTKEPVVIQEETTKKEPLVAPITIEPQPEMRVTERINSVLSNIQMLSESDVRNIIQISASRLSSDTQIELAQMFMRWNHDVLPHDAQCPCLNFKPS